MGDIPLRGPTEGPTSRVEDATSCLSITVSSPRAGCRVRTMAASLIAEVFILNDWGSINTLSGTFAAFNPDGSIRFRRSLHANLFNNGLSSNGRLAVCQMANAPHEDGGKLFVFDLEAGAQIASWQAESGWAHAYEFSEDGKTVRLIYRDRGAFTYGLDGTFIDRIKWLASGIAVGELGIVETLLAETNHQPSPALVEQLLGAIDRALASPTYNAPKWRARAFKLRGGPSLLRPRRSRASC